MPRINNLDTTADTPLTQLQNQLSVLPPGRKITCPNTKEQILSAKENLTRRRHEIPGADSHLEYIDALLIAEANGRLEFKG